MNAGYPSIPSEEHLEAVHADLSAKREEMKREMSPEDRHRLEVIEECAGKLDAAGAPFVLYAAHEATSPEGKPAGWHGWWQFNRMSYSPDWKAKKEETFYAVQSLLPRILTHQSCAWPGAIVVYGPDEKPLWVFRNGEQIGILPSKPEEEAPSQ